MAARLPRDSAQWCVLSLDMRTATVLHNNPLRHNRRLTGPDFKTAAYCHSDINARSTSFSNSGAKRLMISCGSDAIASSVTSPNCTPPL